MNESVLAEPNLEWQDVFLSFVPPKKRTIRARDRLTAWRLPSILALQAVLTWRLTDIVNDDEALYICGGHTVIAHLFHGGASTEALLRLDGSYFSGAPNAYPVVAAGLDAAGGLLLVRMFSLFCMLIATICVYKIGRHLFNDNIALLASLVFAFTGSVQFIGKLATYDAPCLALVALAAMLAVVRKSVTSAPLIGALLAVASVTKYAGLALVPFVLVLTFLAVLGSEGTNWRPMLRPAFMRACLATLVLGGLLLGGYHLWGSGIAGGVNFTTTGRRALDPTHISILLESLLYDIGLELVLAIVGIVVALRERAWPRVMLMLAMLGAGSVIQASSLRIHEFISLDKHTAFSGLFFAVPAAVALNWAISRRGRTVLAALAVIWILLIDGLWRSNLQYNWPATVLEPVGVVQNLNIPGQYFSFDSDTASFYTQDDPGINWYSSAEAYSIFGQGLGDVIQTEESHRFTGFMFQTTNLSTRNLAEIHVLDKVLASDPYYFETGTYRVSAYTKAVWQLWIHYPVGYHKPRQRGQRPMHFGSPS